MFKIFNADYEKARAAICRELKCSGWKIKFKTGTDSNGNWLTGTVDGKTSNKYYY